MGVNSCSGRNDMEVLKAGLNRAPDWQERRPMTKALVRFTKDGAAGEQFAGR